MAPATELGDTPSDRKSRRVAAGSGTDGGAGCAGGAEGGAAADRGRVDTPGTYAARRAADAASRSAAAVAVADGAARPEVDRAPAWWRVRPLPPLLPPRGSCATDWKA